MTVHGVDVSGYQPNWTPNHSDAFVFIKATEGTTYRSSSHGHQVALARAAGLVVGHYHFAHPGSVSGQVSHFLSTPGIEDGDMLVLDWESSPAMSRADAEQWLRAVQAARPKCRVLDYTYTSYWTSHLKRAVAKVTRKGSRFVADGLWIAYYGSRKPNMGVPTPFWQYSDKPIDQDWGYFDSKEALVAWATFGGQPAPAPTPTPTPTPTVVAVSLAVVVHAFTTQSRDGEDCKVVQRALNATGDHLIVDGWPGPQTVAAYQTWQQHLGYTGTAADGIPGPASLGKLGLKVLP